MGARAGAGALALGDPVVRERSAHARAAHHDSLPSFCSLVTQHVPSSTYHPLCTAPFHPQRPACAAPGGVPGIYPPPPGIPIAPTRPTSRCLRSTRNRPTPRTICGNRDTGCPGTPPPPSPLLVVPPLDHRDLELAYLRGHIAGLDRRADNRAPPEGPAQRAPRVPHDPVPGVVGEAAPAQQAAPMLAAEPQEDRCPLVPEKALRPLPEPARRRSRPPEGDRTNTAGMRVPAEMTGRHTAGPTTHLRCTMSDGRTNVPLETEPPPLGATTAPLHGTMTAPAVARPTPSPRKAGGGKTTKTGAGAGLPALILPGACAMMHRTRGTGRNGNPGLLSRLAPHVCRRKNPRTSASMGARRAGRLRPSHPRIPRAGRRHKPLQARKQRGVS